MGRLSIMHIFLYAMLAGCCLGKVIYVDASAPGCGSGTNWHDAFNHLQDALAEAGESNEPIEIWVAKGVYRPDRGKGIKVGDKAASFRLTNRVTIRGGYAGYGQADPNRRDLALYETTLSGNLNGNDELLRPWWDSSFSPDMRYIEFLSAYNQWVLYTCDNSRHVITAVDLGGQAVLDGLTIVAGCGMGWTELPGDQLAYLTSYGGGILVVNGSLSIVNCVIRQNYAWCGGAIYADDSDLALDNCAFLLNHSDIAVVYAKDSQLRLNNCSFCSNFCLGKYDSYGGPQGAGVMCDNSQAEAAHCFFVDNRSGNPQGGAFVNRSGCKTTIRNSIFAANVTSGGAGGAITNISSELSLVNCTFQENIRHAISSCASDRESHVDIVNSIFFGQVGPPLGQLAIFNSDGSIISIRYCSIGGGKAAVRDAGTDESIIWGEGNVEGDPCFAMPGRWVYPWTKEYLLVSGYDANRWVDGDYHLKSQAGRWDPASQTWVKDDVTSPCIDAGDPNSPIGLEPFPNGGRINMGAYGGTQEASKSYFGGPTCETIVSGDIDGDCKVDLHDLAILASHWLERW